MGSNLINLNENARIAPPADLPSTPPARRLKILLSAYACEPGKGSEPGQGWSMMDQVSQLHDVWVITAEEHRLPIEAELRRNPRPNVNWIFADPPRWLTFWKQGERGRRIHYYLWQIAAYFAGRAQHRRTGFDLVHHVTYISYWTPNFLALLGVPFLFGPVGGGESMPAAFRKGLSAEGKRFEQRRDLARGLAHRLDPFLRLTLRRMSLVLATTCETAAKLQEVGVNNIRLLHDVALSDEDLDRLSQTPIDETPEKFSFISMGRLIGWKGYHLSVQAFARFHREYPNSEYRIFGTGMEYDNLKQMVQDLGLEGVIHVAGLVPRDELMEHFNRSHVMVHPSLHDAGGWACVEAMASGRPVICLALGGPGAQVIPEAGFVIPANNPEQVIDEMAAAMLRLAQDPELRLKMARAAREYALREFSWPGRMKKYNALYGELVTT
jgi:glycosyltransferase involved in cell wall biosynthesis